MSRSTRHDTPLAVLDKERIIHPFTSLPGHLKSGPTIMARGKGIYVTDTSGREYIDAGAGLACVNVGYGREEIAKAIYDQARTLSFYHAFWSNSTEPSIRLAERLVDLAPDAMSKVLFATSGSDANDTQVKIAWYYNNVRGKLRKKKIIARHRAYHGSTVAAASLTGLPAMHEAFDLPIPQVLHAAAPDYYRDAEPAMSERDFSRRLAEDLDALIEAEGPDTVAAFIAEPVMGSASGVLVPPDGYFDDIKKVLAMHDVLMIADEVVCGFGRLGAMFGSDVYDIEPDLMTLSKGLTSGYVPMSAALVSEKVWTVLLEGSSKIGPFAHGHTYGAHPLAAAAAMANIDILEGENLVERAASTGAYLRRRLGEELGDHPMVGDIRGVGLIAGIQLVADKATKAPLDPSLNVATRVMQSALGEGLIVRALPGTESIAMSPPLIISETEVDLLVERLTHALRGVCDPLVRRHAVADG